MDNKINYQEVIETTVRLKDGLKSVDLALYVMSQVNPQVFNNALYLNALEGLIEEGIIIQFSYETLLSGTKVMYFPKDTKFWFSRRRF